MAGRKGFRILLWLAAIAVVLVLVVYAAVLILLPQDKIVELIIPRVEKALNRKVTVGDVSFTIWSGIGLRLSDLEVKNPKGFDNPNMLILDHLDVKVKFFPLFKKRLEITSIVLDGLRVNLARTATGLTNYSDLGGAPEYGVERIEPEQAAAALPFSFENLVLSNSSLVYVDDSSGYSIALDGIKLKSTLLTESDRSSMKSSGEMSVDGFTYTVSGEEHPLPSLKLELRHDLTYAPQGDSMTVNSLDFALNELKGKLTGSITSISAEPILDLNIRTEDLSLNDILESIPVEAFPQVADLVGSGKLHMVGDYRGPARLTRIAEIEGKVSMNGIELAHESFKGKLKIKLAELNFTQSNLTFFTDDAELSGEPFKLKAIVDNPPDPSISAEFSMNLNLSVFQPYMEPDADLSGRMKIETTAYGKMNETASMSLLGSLEIENLKYRSKSMDFPVDDLDATFEFLGKDAVVKKFDADLGESDISIQGKIKGFTPYVFLLGDVERKPHFTGRVTSQYLDIDGLFPEEVESVGEPSSVATDTSMLFLPDFDADGTFSISEGIYSLVAFEDATGKYDLTDYVLSIDSVNAKVYDGKVTGSAIIDIENFDRPEYQADYSARGIEINSFLSRFTSFENHLFGEFDIDGSFSGAGAEVKDLLPTLKLSGTGKMRDGKLLNFDLISKLAESVGAKVSNEEKIRDLIGSYRVENGRVFLDDLFLTSSTGDWRLSGSVGFDGSLSYAGDVKLSAKASENLDFLGGLKALFQSDKGDVVLPFKLTGSYAAPEIALDTSPLKENVDNKIKNEKKNLLDKLFKK